MKQIRTIFLGLVLLNLGIIVSGYGGGDKMNDNKIKVFDVKQNKIVLVNKIVKTNEEWKKNLTPEQFEITVNKGTEAPGSCALNSVKEEGVYECVRCGTALFYSRTKFESGTGWPSYFEPVSELNIATATDKTLGRTRTEVLCARCDAHLGHVFNDGPPPTGKRYCINGIALKFRKMPLPKKELASFAAGCFWHVQEVFDRTKGVIGTTVGYQGGKTKAPTYQKVCSSTTGHAETVLVEYDPTVISYDQLLNVFWGLHDPTTPNQQGPDVGEQYRSVIFYHNDQQKELALQSKEKLEKSGQYKNPIVTQIVPAKDFYKAEEYHQKYFAKKKK